mmetsp:Transcript_61942/g.151358  ORF Transcript_61942/g.151358 Transcript_61942/m.151358 type:complete len:211 (-) Transcript_61942:866-1498(-)
MWHQASQRAAAASFRRLLPKTMAVTGATGVVALVATSRESDVRADNSKNSNNGYYCMDTNSMTYTNLDYEYKQQHDPNDFDYYVKNPTVDDLPILLQKFDEEGLDVWPWIWTHPNENGPHHVFVGMTGESVKRIVELRRASSPQNNILVVASTETLEEAAHEAGYDSTDIYNDCNCGIVTDSELELLHVKSKILMLDDERVIAFDYLTIC